MSMSFWAALSLPKKEMIVIIIASQVLPDRRYREEIAMFMKLT